MALLEFFSFKYFVALSGGDSSALKFFFLCMCIAGRYKDVGSRRDGGSASYLT